MAIIPCAYESASSRRLAKRRKRSTSETLELSLDLLTNSPRRLIKRTCDGSQLRFHPLRSGRFITVGTDAWRSRDVYRWLLGLRSPRFAAFVPQSYVGLNLLFAALTVSIQQCRRQHWRQWFFDAFSLVSKRWPPSATATCILNLSMGTCSPCSRSWWALLARGDHRFHFRPLFSSHRARAFQQSRGDRAVEWKTDPDDARWQRKIITAWSKRDFGSCTRVTSRRSKAAISDIFTISTLLRPDNSLPCRVNVSYAIEKRARYSAHCQLLESSRVLFFVSSSESIR